MAILEAIPGSDRPRHVMGPRRADVEGEVAWAYRRRRQVAARVVDDVINGVSFVPFDFGEFAITKDGNRRFVNSFTLWIPADPPVSVLELRVQVVASSFSWLGEPSDAARPSAKSEASQGATKRRHHRRRRRSSPPRRRRRRSSPQRSATASSCAIAEP